MLLRREPGAFSIQFAKWEQIYLTLEETTFCAFYFFLTLSVLIIFFLHFTIISFHNDSIFLLFIFAGLRIVFMRFVWVLSPYSLIVPFNA